MSKALWTIFWDSLSAERRTTVEQQAKKEFALQTGLGEGEMTTDYFNNVIINLYDSSKQASGVNPEGSHATSGQKQNMVRDLATGVNTDAAWTPKIESQITKYVGTTQEAKNFSKSFNAFKDSLKSHTTYTGGTWYQQEWTDEKLKEEYSKHYKEQGGDPDGVATSNTIAMVDASFTTASDEGKVDKTTFDLIEPPAEGEESSTIKQLKAITSKSGFSLSDEGYKHFEKLIKSNEIDLYEAEQLMKSDPAYVEAENKRLVAEYEPTLLETEKKELALIEEAATTGKLESAKQFKEVYAPEIRREIGGLGYLGKESTFQADALSKAAADLEETRTKYFDALKLSAKEATITAQQQLKAGEFAGAKERVAAVNAASSTQYLNALKTQMDNASTTLSTLSNRAATLTQRAADRYTREQNNELKRLQNEYIDRVKAANKKASKFGLGASVLQGMVTGAMVGGPVGAVVGAAAGFGSGYLNQQNINAANIAAPGTAPGIASYNTWQPDYSGIATGAQSYWNQYVNRNNAGRTENEKSFAYLRR